MVASASCSAEKIVDVAVVGAGAAGLATAIFVKRQQSTHSVALFDTSARPGAKILVSGGGRCNVTNALVRDTDFWGGKRTIIRRVLQGFPTPACVAFFRELGITLHEEPGGKLFPDSNRARDVLDGLLRECARLGVDLVTGARVASIAREESGFVLETAAGVCRARSVVLATGGQSLPKSGSDGHGYVLARTLGHTIVPPTPALAPLLLDPDAPAAIHARVSGVSVDAEIAVWIDDALAVRLAGALLWTHFGISGPLALNVSRHWARAVLEGRAARLTVSMFPGESFEAIDERITAAARQNPRQSVRSLVARTIPDGLATTILEAMPLRADLPLADLSREDRRRLVHALTEWPLPVTGTRGYNFAEVTAGGVALTEIDPGTMASRACPGLFLVGEILDVDGRIGGFNFHWAWASAYAAARGLALLARGTAVPASGRGAEH